MIEPGGERAPELGRLRPVLLRAQERGLVGPGPVAAHVHHAEAFAATVVAAGVATGAVVDLGSGGGVPGLVLALLWPWARVVLLETARRRTAFLAEAVEELELVARVAVLEGRAEEIGRDPVWRERQGLVVARAFGSPAVTAECGAPLVAVGGALVVSEPPAGGGGEPVGEGRWPASALAPLGLVPRPRVVHQGRSFRVLDKVGGCEDRFPRRTGVPGKRPLFPTREG
ncbi:MAG TPA: RsmG family class I SAM-dependent methyltransferase [Acidimicrobiales bacterium]|nr:RsmG family class I SAM-dependent methyltransferase [Acidimicrobiales bacterium]